MRSIAFALVGICLAACGGTPDGDATTESALASAPAKPTSADSVVLPEALKCVDLGRYQVKGSAVSDTENGGKLWQRFVDPVTRSQPDAAAYCSSLSVDGRAGWRLPSVNELSTIRYKPGLIQANETACLPAIDQSAFPDTPANRFWTATVRPLGDAYYTSFADGRSHGSELDEPMFVRCVHDGPHAGAASVQAAAD
ncbi:MAG: DUF1566 domain-containing protein [Polyangiaceae bacterium]